ncbi:hypothetical protein H5399_14215 [Tessaracoccus sp. MC1627]|uniref:hypothetical protein n=1 Tax=Tessaracoccus sp. MC1627 TaxID=2760312 RepID=UPI001603A819|nr:hypothetical protein [Tessaracoccus sp. MC1627]MBB1513750.1 hypothetical protein [Tessaracoccus sp. MC1627]
MGFLGKLLRRDTGDDDGEVILSPFSPESVRPYLSDLIEALSALTEAMDSEGAPLSNPGWRGRLHDLREAHGGLRMLARRTNFTKEDLYEELTCVRPLYRGDPPKDFAHLAPLNDRVVEAIESVHRAAAS